MNLGFIFLLLRKHVKKTCTSRFIVMRTKYIGIYFLVGMLIILVAIELTVREFVQEYDATVFITATKQ